MEHKAEELKGRAKKAAGDLKGDKRLKGEGQLDQAAGRAKRGVDKAKERTEEALESSKKGLQRVAEETEEEGEHKQSKSS